VFDGEPGKKARLIINPETENEDNITIFAVNEGVDRGDVMSFWSAGGGGYGDPLKRDLERIVEDIKDGYVTVEGAREQYGAVVKEIDVRRLIYEIDVPATDTLRKDMRAARA
jgi:N-methylhydantoinase B